MSKQQELTIYAKYPLFDLEMMVAPLENLVRSVQQKTSARMRDRERETDATRQVVGEIEIRKQSDVCPEIELPLSFVSQPVAWSS